MTDTMGRMHSDAQFAGSSSVPAHVEMMGFLGIGNNPMVGCTVACAVTLLLLLICNQLILNTIRGCFSPFPYFLLPGPRSVPYCQVFSSIQATTKAIYYFILTIVQSSSFGINESPTAIDIKQSCSMTGIIPSEG